MNAKHGIDVADRLRWGLTPLAVLIGLTAYVASDDIAVSIALTAALGLSALIAAWLLLRNRRGGPLLAGASASVLIAVQFIDLNRVALGWMRLSYAAIGVLTLVFAAAAMIASRWGLRRASRERIAP